MPLPAWLYAVDLMELAIVAGAFSLAGVALGAVLEWLRERWRRGNEITARLRDWRLAALNETRLMLIGQLTWHEQRALLHLEPNPPVTRGDLTRGNINLVGDPDVIREFTDVMLELNARLPMTRLEEVRQILPKSLASLDLDMLDRTTKLRARVLKALDDQEMLALRDKPLRELSADEISSIAGADAMLESMRDRQRKGKP